MRLLILTIFLTLTAAVPHCDGQETSETDSLKQLIRTSDNDSLKMQWYNRLRRITYYSDPDGSFLYTKKFLELAEKNNYPFETALARFYMGNSYVIKSEYNLALANYLEAAAYFERVKDSTRLASVYNGIGAAYENNGNDSLSLNYFKKSQHLSELSGDKRRSALALNNMANIYKRRGEIAMSIFCLEKAVNDLEGDDPQYLNPVLVNLANSLMENNEMARAEEIYARILPAIDPNKDAFTYIALKHGMGNIAKKKGRYKIAVAELEEGFAMATAGNFFDLRYDMMKDLIDAFALNNQHKDGLRLFYEYDRIRDSLFTSEKDKNLSESIQKYEALKKDEAIAQQKLQIASQSRMQNMLISGTAVLAFFFVLLFAFYRSRLKYQKTIAMQHRELQQQKITELEQKNKLVAMSSMIAGQETERKRIAKDLHDGLGGLLSSIKTHFSMSTVHAATGTELLVKTNRMIDEACAEVRRISHNMMPQALTLSCLEDALADLAELLCNDKITATIEISKISSPPDDDKSIMIYRLAQEIIANIRKHADASHVLFQLLEFENRLTLTVEDDGKGFDLEAAKRQAGIGLRSIFNRVDLLDGTIIYDTRPGHGTSIIIEIPTA